MARALPDLIARIRLDSSGIDEAISNLTGSFGKANLALAGVAAGLGVLIIGGKSMIDISEKHDAATLALAQAYKTAGLNIADYRTGIDSFIQSNRSYISSQSDVIDGYAKLTRSGLTQDEVQKDMNRALDLSALKHISLTDAVTLLDAAEHGRMRGLIDLGITTAKYTDANGNLVPAMHSVKQAMEELDPKLKGGRQSTTELSGAANRLSNDWQDLAKTGGPPLEKKMAQMLEGLDNLYQGFVRFGKDDSWWKGFNDGLVNIAHALASVGGWMDVVNGKDLGRTLNDWRNQSQAAIGGGGGPNLASGGSALSGHTYTVGEEGPETLVMGQRGGMVIPNAGGGGGSPGGHQITFNIYGATDAHAVAVAVDQRLNQAFMT